MFEDNVELYTLLAVAIRAGNSAVKAERGEFDDDTLYDGYDSEPEQPDDQDDQDEYDFKFADRHSRSRLRHYMRKPRTTKPAVTGIDHDQVLRDRKDDFMEALARVEANLRRHHRPLQRDLRAAIDRWLAAPVNSDDELRPEVEKVQHLVRYLEELTDETKLARRIRLLTGSVLTMPGHNLDEIDRGMRVKLEELLDSVRNHPLVREPLNAPVEDVEGTLVLVGDGHCNLDRVSGVGRPDRDCDARK